MLERESATCGNRTRLFELLEGSDRRVHDVDRVRRTERLRQHVVDSGALEHGANRTTGDDTGTGSGRTKQDDACCGLTLHGVRDGAADARNAEEVALGLFDTLRSLGLKRIGHTVVRTADAVTVGMLNTVPHLVQVEEAK